MKTCFKCGEEKSLDEFYAHPKMADGHLNKCKSCTRVDSRTHQDENLERVREYDRGRSSLPHRVEARKAYQASDQGKDTMRSGRASRAGRYPGSKKANSAVSNAIRDGRLEKQFHCEDCSGTYRVEAHHDDYNKPLSVRWLCEDCHKDWHKHNSPIYAT